MKYPLYCQLQPSLLNYIKPLTFSHPNPSSKGFFSLTRVLALVSFADNLPNKCLYT